MFFTYDGFENPFPSEFTRAEKDTLRCKVGELLSASLFCRDSLIEFPNVSSITYNCLTCNINLNFYIFPGEFAEVFLGNLRTKKGYQRVAVKRLKANASCLDESNFLREAWTIAQFHHPNVVKLKGVITKSK